MRLGAFSLVVVDAGWHALDGGSLFGIVPKPLWEPRFPADARNRVDLAIRLLLLETGERRILIDAGIGNKFTVGGKAMYKLRQPVDCLRGALVGVGVDPETITDVLVTHGHFDHVGGLTRRTEEGEIVPTLPRARVHIQRRAFEWAMSPSAKDAGSFHATDLPPLLEAGILRLLDGPQDLFDGVTLLLSEGHTVAQQMVLVDGGVDGKLLCCGDLLPTTGHLNLAWISAHDLHPLVTVDEKQQILTQATTEGWIVFFGHDPLVPACRVANESGQFIVAQRVDL